MCTMLFPVLNAIIPEIHIMGYYYYASQANVTSSQSPFMTILPERT